MKELLCEDCNWTGAEDDCIKKYEGVPLTDGDVELHLYCSNCGNENLIELLDEGAEIPVPV